MHPEGLTFGRTSPIYDFLLHSRFLYILLKVKAKEKKDLWSPGASGRERRLMMMVAIKRMEINAVTVRTELLNSELSKVSRGAIILPLSKTHHTGLKGSSVNAWAVDKAKHGAEK